MKHLLFVPASKYREALLGDGVAVATVPAAFKALVPRHGEPWVLTGVPLGYSSSALVLVWRDTAAIEGCDRLERALLAKAGSTVEWIPRRPDVADARNLASNAAKAGLGTVVEVEG